MVAQIANLQRLFNEEHSGDSERTWKCESFLIGFANDADLSGKSSVRTAK